MKNSKKILGVVLALAMLLNVFAVVSFAGEPSIIFSLSCDKTNYAAGDDVVITVSVKTASSVGNIYNGGGFPIGYNSDVINPYAATDVPGDHGVTGIAEGYDDSTSGVLLNDVNIGNGDTVDEGNDWDEILCFQNGTSCVPLDATTETQLFSFKMKLADELADGEYVIGFNEGSFDNYSGFLMTEDCDIYPPDTGEEYEYGKLTITVGEAAKPITFVKTQAQWVDGDNTQTNWNLGIVGTFKADDIAIAFDEGGTSTNVTEVGVKVTGDYTTTQTTRFVYDNGNGTYSYRAVVTNIPYDVASGTELTVTFFAVLDGAEVEGETVTIDLAEAFARAQGNGMPAYAG